MHRICGDDKKGSWPSFGSFGSELGLTYEVPLPVGDVSADVAALLVVQLQVNLRRETLRYIEFRK